MVPDANGGRQEAEMVDRYEPVVVSRTIRAEPGVIFGVLADPGRHQEIDGSGMLRTVAVGSPITRVGDEFTMNMFFERLGGDYRMINRVVEFEPDRRIGWEPAPGDERSAGNEPASIGVRVGHRWTFALTPDGSGNTLVTEIYDSSDAPVDLQREVRGGKIWEDSMTKTLERLDQVCSES
jgi:uncharacterized protein YndB with AHSA1/START domain